MQLLYCWRCRTNIPMLDEQEWEIIESILRRCIEDTQTERTRGNVPLSGSLLERRFKPALEAYARLTGFQEANPNAVWHHRLSIYGPPCAGCGKPLRTPQAIFCAGCGQRAAEIGPE